MCTHSLPQNFSTCLHFASSLVALRKEQKCSDTFESNSKKALINAFVHEIKLLLEDKKRLLGQHKKSTLVVFLVFMNGTMSTNVRRYYLQPARKNVGLGIPPPLMPM